ncbi:MAG: hypothetical protein RLZZ488_2781 [Pseudomonadota bacterium]|jgi:hypothetical protein
MEVSKFQLTTFAVSLVAVGLFLGIYASAGRAPQSSGQSVVLMAPAPDPKTELAYRRNGFADRIMTVQRREALTNCYTEFLKSNGIDESNSAATKTATGADLSKFEGKVTYVFQIAENGEKITHEIVDSQISDRNFLGCIEVALRGVRFLPPPLGINRYLSHEFTFKSEQTYRKEMEEKKSQEPLVLITVTPKAP